MNILNYIRSIRNYPQHKFSVLTTESIQLIISKMNLIHYVHHTIKITKFKEVRSVSQLKSFVLLTQLITSRKSRDCSLSLSLSRAGRCLDLASGAHPVNSSSPLTSKLRVTIRIQITPGGNGYFMMQVIINFQVVNLSLIHI